MYLRSKISTHGVSPEQFEVDKGNFDSFWRAVGDFCKERQGSGRWGLGKLVYSSSSALRMFFGLSITREHTRPALMGQAVLKNHRIGNDFHPAHGFYFGDRAGVLKLQHPIEDENEVGMFRRLAGLDRTDQTGLSLIIPYILDEIDDASIIPRPRRRLGRRQATARRLARSRLRRDLGPRLDRHCSPPLTEDEVARILDRIASREIQRAMRDPGSQRNARTPAQGAPQAQQPSRRSRRSAPRGFLRLHAAAQIHLRADRRDLARGERQRPPARRRRPQGQRPGSTRTAPSSR